jgi:hypothetical protein
MEWPWLFPRRWQAGGTYLKATQEYIRKCNRPSHVRDSTYLGLGIFDLIAENVNVEEQFELGKLYLEQDLKMPRPYQHGPGPSWILLGRWDQACNCHEWRDARQILENTVKTWFCRNELFLRSALYVTAERFLKYCRDQLEALKALAKPLSVVGSQSATRHRNEYREVFQGMCELKLDIDPHGGNTCGRVACGLKKGTER